MRPRRAASVPAQLIAVDPDRHRADGAAAGHDGQGDLREVLLRAFVESWTVDEDRTLAAVEAANPLRLVALHVVAGALIGADERALIVHDERLAKDRRCCV